MQPRLCPSRRMPRAQSLHPEAIRATRARSEQCNAISPSRTTISAPARGLVNSAILYPVTRALFSTRPLPSANRCRALLFAWPNASPPQQTLYRPPDKMTLSLLAARRSRHRQLQHRRGQRWLPNLRSPRLSRRQRSPRPDHQLSLLQRHQTPKPPSGNAPAAPSPIKPSVSPRPSPSHLTIAPRCSRPSAPASHHNLHDIWSPRSATEFAPRPQKLLARARPENFRMPDNLWARIVYDFILAFRLFTHQSWTPPWRPHASFILLGSPRTLLSSAVALLRKNTSRTSPLPSKPINLTSCPAGAGLTGSIQQERAFRQGENTSVATSRTSPSGKANPLKASWSNSARFFPVSSALLLAVGIVLTAIGAGSRPHFSGAA